MNTEKEIVFNSNGWQALNRIGILNENYYTFILNYKDLIEEIINIESTNEPLISLLNNKNLNRYIFNFFASTSALIDSCRNIMNFYKETNIYTFYTKSKKEQFSQNSIAIFIKDLRKYLMH